MSSFGANVKGTVVKFDDFQIYPFAAPRSFASPLLAVSILIEAALLHLPIPPGATFAAKAEVTKQNEAMVTNKTIASFLIVYPPLP